jgi:hypothetical protein
MEDKTIKPNHTDLESAVKQTVNNNTNKETIVSVNTDGKDTPDDQTIASHNREQLDPFMAQFVETIYAELDKAADNGVILQSGLTADTADQIISQALWQIQIDYAGNQVVDRNIIETAAFYIGSAVGYPTELLCAALRKIPLSAHFRAGFRAGTVTCDQHMLAVYMKVFNPDILGGVKVQSPDLTPEASVNLQPVGAAA